MFVCCECCVLSGRGLRDKLITRPEECYRLWCVVVCDLETLKNEEAMTRVIYMQYFFSEGVGVSTFRLEELGGSFFRSSGILVPGYTASHPRIS